mmetsp:Transcript_11757/g.30176  ORF Transcript_11757/g.30176 Transcript_11757/m.30176 type:complete len:168 (-) Transcript_11757:735-1238(-)
MCARQAAVRLGRSFVKGGSSPRVQRVHERTTNTAADGLHMMGEPSPPKDRQVEPSPVETRQLPPSAAPSHSRLRQSRAQKARGAGNPMPEGRPNTAEDPASSHSSIATRTAPRLLSTSPDLGGCSDGRSPRDKQPTEAATPPVLLRLPCALAFANNMSPQTPAVEHL